MDGRVTEFAVAEAKARFSELLARAEAGEDITINRHGKAVARLSGVRSSLEDDVARKQRAMDEWKAYRSARKLKLGPLLTIRQLIDWGRKY